MDAGSEEGVERDHKHERCDEVACLCISAHVEGLAKVVYTILRERGGRRCWLAIVLRAWCLATSLRRPTRLASTHHSSSDSCIRLKRDL